MMALALGDVGSRARSFVLLRFCMIAAACFMLLSQGVQPRLTSLATWLMFAAIASNLLLLRVPSSRIDSPVAVGALVLIDTIWITLALVATGTFGTEVFLLYFFVLFLAAIGENLRIIVLAALVVCGAYLYGVGRWAGLHALGETSTLIRVPFLFSVAIFHGYLVDQVRRSRLEAEEQAKKALMEKADWLSKQNEELASEVSRRQELEAQLRQSQKMEAVGMLAAGIAHDFNNMLTVVNGYSELLEQELNEDQESRFYAQQIKMAGAHAASLTRQLLAFSRQQILDPVVCDLSAIVQDMTAVLSRTLGEKITLVLGLEGELGRCEVDPVQVQQVILNLALNARDAMPDGGRLTIETANLRLTHQDSSEGFQVEPGRYVMLAVSDEGRGMDDETQRRAFDPFFTTKASGKGSGLGLSTVYGIVKQSHGYIWIESEIGKGTRVRICFPRVRADAPAHPAESAEAASAAKPGTILLVEDEQMVRTFAASCLRESGFSVLEVGSAEEAMELLGTRSVPVDLIVSDVGLPGRSGFDLTREVRHLGLGIGVVLVSGYQEYQADKEFDLAVGRLNKPFSRQGLVNMVRRALSRSESFPASSPEAG